MNPEILLHQRRLSRNSTASSGGLHLDSQGTIAYPNVNIQQDLKPSVAHVVPALT